MKKLLTVLMILTMSLSSIAATKKTTTKKTPSKNTTAKKTTTKKETSKKTTASKTYQTGREAYTIEQKLLKDFASVGYVGDKILKTGNTEIFTEDIFKGDYSYFTH